MTCSICGNLCDDALVNEMWAGTLHSACFHAACAGCLREWIGAELPRCRSEGVLRVRCYAPGCQKVIPQTLILHISSAANGLALEIDRQADRLQQCYLDLSIDWMPTNCTVCNDYCGPQMLCKGCGFAACEFCMGSWIDEQIPRCIAQYELDGMLRCFNPKCNQSIDEVAALHVSTSARDLKRKLAKRRKLQRNELYPSAMQIDCPLPGCVGLGYLGFDTVMCFICEHQWSADVGDTPVGDLPGGLKSCPKCNSQIEKNGGCDHMTCRCGHEFFWSTLLPYKRQ